MFGISMLAMDPQGHVCWGEGPCGLELVPHPTHAQLVQDLEGLEAGSTSHAICHVPIAVPGSFFAV